MGIDPELLKYATPTQAKNLQALIDHGSQRKAAKALGISKSAISGTIERVQAKAVRQGYSPEHGMIYTSPEGLDVRGVSQYHPKTDTAPAQWVRMKANNEQQERLLRIVADTLADGVRGLSRQVKAPTECNKDIMAGYPLPESHFGMLSWGKETGVDYDCSIAAGVLCSGMKNLVDSAPPAETALIADIGDFFHTDTTDNKTAKAGNQLDVDSRWPRIVKLGVEVFIEMVGMALAKHKFVVIKGVGGNHSPHSSFMLAMILDAYFRNNERISVDLSPNPYKFHRFGSNLIGINHGDMGKPAELPMVMAEDCPDWSDTKFRVWWTGHVHHLTRKEYPGCVVETFRSVAAKDSWHHQSGYRAGRDAQCIIFHRDRGEVQRITVAV